MVVITNLFSAAFVHPKGSVQIYYFLFKDPKESSESETVQKCDFIFK